MIKTNKKKSYILSIFILLCLTTINLAVADSNGIWHLAGDIRTGTFGSDESGIGAYTFQDIVNFNEHTFFTNTIDITVNGENGIHVVSVGANSGLFDGGNFIVKNGNVGIGVDNPTSGLEVVGGVVLTHPGTYSSIRANNDDTTLTIDGGYNRFNNPKIKLHSVSNQNRIYYEAKEHIFTSVDSGVGGTPLMTILDNGNVGIGTTTPTSALEVNGDIAISGVIKNTAGGNVVIQLS